jgi:hypothetical protein
MSVNYLKTFRKAAQKSPGCDISYISDQSPPGNFNLNLTRSPEGDLRSHKSLLSQVGDYQKSFADDFAALERRCPDYVEQAPWQRAVDDGRRFLATWGEQAAALGWTAAELFGLHEPPSNPRPSYKRLSRYDATGLVWLLRGMSVVALTEDTATIKSGTEATVVYRKNPKPALGPLDDSLDDFA